MSNGGRRLPSPSRRDFLGAVGICVALERIDATVFAEVPRGGDLARPAARGRRFLEGLFDPALDLLPEYRGTNVYWLFHDNYLSAKLLKASKPDLSERISASIRRFGIEHSGKIEILFGEAKRPLPFRQYELTEVRRVGEKVVKTEVVKDQVLEGWQQYADLLFLAAIAEPDREKARRHFGDGLKMWDGTGFLDLAAKSQKLYSTYKLALSLIAAARLGVEAEPKAAIVRRLLDLQGQDGGWITDFDAQHTPVGVANVETTCMAVLGLESAPGLDPVKPAGGREVK